MRVALLAAAAILVPVAVWHRPAEPSAAADERPDRVLAATFEDHRPSVCGATWSCCKYHRDGGVLVEEDAIVWVGSRYALFHGPQRLARDGSEWEQLVPVLRARGALADELELHIAVADDARYEDLLVAMMTAQAAGLSPRVVVPSRIHNPPRPYRRAMPSVD